MDDHGLACDGTGGEGQAFKDLVCDECNEKKGLLGWMQSQSQPSRVERKHLRITSTAPATLIATIDGRRGEAIGKVVVDCPWRVVGASKGIASVAATLSIRSERVVVLVASEGWSVDCCFTRPCTRRLAAIPVSGRMSGSRGGKYNSGGGEGQKGLE